MTTKTKLQRQQQQQKNINNTNKVIKVNSNTKSSINEKNLRSSPTSIVEDKVKVFVKGSVLGLPMGL
jgi:hypothetical protein